MPIRQCLPRRDLLRVLRHRVENRRHGGAAEDSGKVDGDAELLADGHHLERVLGDEIPPICEHTARQTTYLVRNCATIQRLFARRSRNLRKTETNCARSDEKVRKCKISAQARRTGEQRRVEGPRRRRADKIDDHSRRPPPTHQSCVGVHPQADVGDLAVRSQRPEPGKHAFRKEGLVEGTGGLGRARPAVRVRVVNPLDSGGPNPQPFVFEQFGKERGGVRTRVSIASPGPRRCRDSEYDRNAPLAV